MSLFMLPAMAQHNNRHNNRHDNHHEVIHHDDHHHPTPVVIRIATPDEVGLIKQLVDNLSTSDEKANAIVTCMKLAPMRAEDLASVIHKIPFDDDKYKVLESCYPFCPNKDRYSVAIEQLSFHSNKDKMYRFIATH